MTKSKHPANISRERLRQLKKNARGLCLRAACDERKRKWGMCKLHAEAESARKKAAYAAKKAKAA